MIQTRDERELAMIDFMPEKRNSSNLTAARELVNPDEAELKIVQMHILTRLNAHADSYSLTT